MMSFYRRGTPSRDALQTVCVLLLVRVGVRTARLLPTYAVLEVVDVDIRELRVCSKMSSPRSSPSSSGNNIFDTLPMVRTSGAYRRRTGPADLRGGPIGA